MGELNGESRHEKFVRRLRALKLPGQIAGGILDWYCERLGRTADPQEGVTYFGATFLCDPVDTLQRMILLYNVWEPGISQKIEEILQPGDVFVDIGANIGYDTLLAATLVGSAGSVVAFEASPDIYGKLQDNLDRNPASSSRVRPLNIAVSDRPGVLELYDFGPQNIGGTTTLASRQGRHCGTVKAQQLGELLTDDENAAFDW